MLDSEHVLDATLIPASNPKVPGDPTPAQLTFRTK